jgi:hypothetical protein
MERPNAGKGSRERLAELTSTVGAGLLGVGLGSWLSPWIGREAGLLLVLGIAMHSWGMFDMRRMEGKAAKRPLWSLVLYWVCIGSVGPLYWRSAFGWRQGARHSDLERRLGSIP